MEESAFLEKFYDKPFKISSISRDNHHYNFLGILHILLVKNSKKKFHFCGGDLVQNGLKISEALKVPCKKIRWAYKKELCQDNKIHERMMEQIVKVSSVNSIELCFSMNKKSISELEGSTVTTRSVGELFEYPKCCIDWFNESKWKDVETVHDLVMSRLANYEPLNKWDELQVRLVAKLILKGEKAPLSSPQLLSRQKERELKNNLESRKKFPFVFHKACDSCLGSKDSPSEKLNKIYSEFAKEKYPNLHNLIMSESKKEINATREYWTQRNLDN